MRLVRASLLNKDKIFPFLFFSARVITIYYYFLVLFIPFYSILRRVAPNHGMMFVGQLRSPRHDLTGPVTQKKRTHVGECPRGSSTQADHQPEKRRSLGCLFLDFNTESCLLRCFQAAALPAFDLDPRC